MTVDEVRLVHDGKQVITVIETNTSTTTVSPHTIYIRSTLEECFAEFKRLGLKNATEFMSSDERTRLVKTELTELDVTTWISTIPT